MYSFDCPTNKYSIGLDSFRPFFVAFTATDRALYLLLYLLGPVKGLADITLSTGKSLLFDLNYMV